MDFVWVFPLLLVFLSIGQIHTKDTEKSSEICKQCPAGYYKFGACLNGKYTCKQCESGMYTEIPNTLNRCLRCDACSGNEVKIRSCSFNRNVECDCMDGYYYQGSGHSRYCIPCKDIKENDLGSCKNNTDCERKCTATRKTTTTTPPTTPTTPPTTTTSTTITTTDNQTSSPNSQNPAVDHLLPKNDMLWLFYVLVFLVVVVMIFGLVLLFIWMHSGKPNTCTWWGTNKEHCSQDSSPTTLTINISEETPMMPFNYSPNTSQHPAHVPPLLPNSAQKGLSFGQSIANV